MSEFLKTIAVCTSACIAFLAFCVGVVHYSSKFIKYVKSKKEKRLLSKNEKLRIEKEKEIAYKLYLDAKSKEVK